MIQLGFKILGDLASRMYAGGIRDGTAETTAQFLKQIPPGMNVEVVGAVEVAEGPLGAFDLDDE